MSDNKSVIDCNLIVDDDFMNKDVSGLVQGDLKMSSYWVITEEVNDYNQYGEYFHSVFKVKPSIEEVKDICGVNDSLANHILNGGGRVNYENSWYNLHEVEFGTKYQNI